MNANIQITPVTDANTVGTNHVLTITVNALGGTIDAGPQTATASIVSGPGSFVSSPSCTYTGGAATATCTVTITSSVTGTTVVSATSNIPVAGETITRTTNTAVNTAAGGSGNASKLWVNANIQITPVTDANTVGTNHVLTITVNALGGTIDAGPQTTTASIVSGPGSFVSSPSCTYTGGAATATCTVTITSSVTGTTVVSATSNIPVAGETITRTTNTAVNTAAGGSGNASKLWVNANIQITPVTDANTVGTNHVLTITVNALGGTIDAGPQTATASIVSGPGSFVSSPSCTYTGGAATATCTVTITSSVTGTTVVSATSNIPVAGETITRTTNTAVNTAAGGSNNATIDWQGGADTTKPTCLIVESSASRVVFQVRDTGSGLSRFKVVYVLNATLAFPSFQVGTTQPLLVTATVVDPAVGYAITFNVFDVAGNKRECDPIVTLVTRETGKPVGRSLSDLSQTDHVVLVRNGRPGVTNLELDVNGVTFHVAGLQDGEARTVDVARAMHPGSTNEIKLTARGRPGGTATVIISD